MASLRVARFSLLALAILAAGGPVRAADLNE